MRFLTWHRRRGRLVLLGALLAVWAYVLWSTGWTVSDLLDAQAASAPSGSADSGTHPAADSAAGQSGTAR